MTRYFPTPPVFVVCAVHPSPISFGETRLSENRPNGGGGVISYHPCDNAIYHGTEAVPGTRYVKQWYGMYHVRAGRGNITLTRGD